RFLERLKARHTDFEPGLKCVRLARSLQRMSEADLARFGEAYSAHDMWLAEDLLLKNCAYSYPHSREIYEDWKAHLDEIAAVDDDRLVRLRAYSCQRRLQEPFFASFKRISGFLEHKLPLFILNNKGLQSLAFSWDYLDPEENQMLAVDLLR